MPLYRYQIGSTGIIDFHLSKLAPAGYVVKEVFGPTLVDIEADASQKLDLDSAMKVLGMSEVFIIDPPDASGTPLVTVGETKNYSIARWNVNDTTLLDSLTELDANGNLAISGVYKIGEDQFNISHLSDVNTIGAASGEVLKFDGTNWLPEEDLTGTGGSDPDAIHDNVAGEIAAVTAKGTPVAGDFLLIEDSAASNAKKRITIGSLPAGGGTPRDTFVFRLNGKPSVSTKVDGTWNPKRAGTFTGVYFHRETAGSAGSAIVDINKNGTTIYTTQANRPTIAAASGNNFSVTTTPNVTSFAVGDKITMDIDSIETGNSLDYSVTIEVQYT
jgi:hypothetical protein